MPVTIVVGGQFGSEGKGKVACAIAREHSGTIAVRVGGSNSGHTVIDERGKVRAFRQLPTAAILPDTTCVIAAGSYIEADVLSDEIRQTGLTPDRLVIDADAVLISERHRKQERNAGLKEKIGSTGSGTGAAVIDRVSRVGTVSFVRDDKRFSPYVGCARSFLRRQLKNERQHVIIEGTQGFGLSLLHSGHYPNVTSRDTTAAGFLSETGLGPTDVNKVVLVIRAFPIRVAGNSGPIPDEIDWDTITRESGSPHDLEERTTVTGHVRRVARFNADIVKAAIEANAPTKIVLNYRCVSRNRRLKYPND
ncbi:MAG: adenylosuccinate synthetase [Alphaproteobacteria bacterium]|nr:adenylosuccinate synthetase [Alphaproteobacteria bacterium]